MAVPFEYRLTDFSGGLNTNASPYLIGDNQASYIRNVDFDGADVGALKKRAGWTKLNSSALGSSTGIYSIYRAWFADATSIIMVSSHTITARWDGANWQNLTTGLTNNQRFGYTMFNSLAISGNAAESTKKMTSTGTESALGGSPPNAKYFATWLGRVWAAGNATFPNRLYWSAVNNEADWTTSGDAGNIDIDKDSGDNITGIMVSGNRLLIFKNSSIHQFSFTSPQSNRVDPITTKVGTISGWSCVDVDGVIVFLHGAGGWRKGVYALDQNNGLKLLSKDITPTFEGITATAFQTSCAAFYKNSYWLSIDGSASGANDTILTLNLQTGAWSYYTGIPAASLYADTRLGTVRLFAGNASAGTVMQPDNGTDDNGSAINFAWRSKHFSFGKPENRKTIQDLHFMGKTQTCTITANCYINSTDAAWNTTLQFGGNANAINIKTIHPTDAAQNGNTWALDLAANNTYSVTIYSVGMKGLMEDATENGF